MTPSTLNPSAPVIVVFGGSRFSRREKKVIIKRARVAAAILVVAGTFLATAGSGGTAVARNDFDSRHVRLSGFEEDPLVLSTTGNGRFTLRINLDNQEARYQLSYSALEGDITQAHIHIGGRAQSGGIAVFLCSNLGNGPAGTQLCPAAPAEISGTFGPAAVIGPAGQGVAAGEFAEVVTAIRMGKAYVNVHSSRYPGGEIRAQLDHSHR
jgi:CHRD domain